MKEYIIFAGTTEGKLLSQGLLKAGISHTLCVATGYGELVIEPHPLVNIHKGRMDRDEIKEFIKAAEVVFDATHPYANVVTENIKEACGEAGINYVRVLRDRAGEIQDKDVYYFDDVKSCAEALASSHGNILLTTGSKDLKTFTDNINEIERIFARVLPSEESIALCRDASLEGAHVIAMQGPFDVDMNKALIKQFDIAIMVTKESGAAGGFPEKVVATHDMGISLYVIGRPTVEEGVSVREALREYAVEQPVKISLIGIGPGNPDYLVKRAGDAIRDSEIIFGASRMIEPYKENKKTYPYYIAKDVLPVILNERPESVAILFSGDSGYYSGAEKMLTGLRPGLDEAGIPYEIEIIPGISSISIFSAKTGISYSDADLTSLHGKSDEQAFDNLVKKIRAGKKIFTLLSGKDDAIKLLDRLSGEFGEGIRLLIGYELSYPKERIIRIDFGDDDAAKKSTEYMKPSQGKKEIEDLGEGLYIACIENDNYGKE